MANVHLIIEDQQGIVTLNAKLKWPMGMRLKEVFLHGARAYLLKIGTEPGAFRFEIDEVVPSHIGCVALTRVCTDCIIYGHAVDFAEGSPAATVSCSTAGD